MAPSKGRSYTIRTEDGMVREMSTEELLSKLVRKSKRRTPRGASGSETNNSHRHGSISPQRFQPQQHQHQHQRHHQVPSRVSVPQNSSSSNNNNNNNTSSRSSSRRSGQFLDRGEQVHDIDNYRSPENERRDSSDGEERRDPPATRNEYQRPPPAPPEDKKPTEEPPAWSCDGSVERSSARGMHYHHPYVIETSDSVDSDDHHHQQQPQQQQHQNAYSEEKMPFRTTPSRSKGYTPDFQHMIKRTNSTASYTVNTEKEGTKIMSQAEISKLVRSSIIKARQQGPQPATKVFKSLSELSSPLNKQQAQPKSTSPLSPRSPESQVSQSGMAMCIEPSRFLWAPILPEANVEPMVASSSADCTEPSQLTEPSTLVPNNHNRVESEVVSVARTELYEEIHSRERQPKDASASYSKHPVDAPVAPMPRVVPGEVVEVIGEAEVVDDLPDAIESLREDPSTVASDSEAMESNDDASKSVSPTASASVQEIITIVDDENIETGEDSKSVLRESVIGDEAFETNYCPDNNEEDRSVAATSNLESEDLTTMEHEAEGGEGNPKEEIPRIIEMSDNDIANLVHNTMDKAHSSARKEVQELLQHSKRRKDTIEIKTAEGKKVMSQQDVAELVKESLLRARESAQEEIANLVKDSVRLARESAQEEIRAMVQESMVRARESAQKEMSEMIRESMQKARLSDASLSTMTGGGYSLLSPSEFAAPTPIHSNHSSCQIPVVQGYDHLKALSEESMPQPKEQAMTEEIQELDAIAQELNVVQDDDVASHYDEEESLHDTEDRTVHSSHFAIVETSSPDVFFGIEDGAAQKSCEPIERKRESREQNSQLANEREGDSLPGESSRSSLQEEHEEQNELADEGEEANIMDNDGSAGLTDQQDMEPLEESPAIDDIGEVAEKEEGSTDELDILVYGDGCHEVQSPEEKKQPEESDSIIGVEVTAEVDTAAAEVEAAGYSSAEAMTTGDITAREDKSDTQRSSTIYNRMKGLEKARKRRIKKAAMALMKKREEHNKELVKHGKKSRRRSRQRRPQTTDISTDSSIPSTHHNNLPPFTPSAFRTRHHHRDHYMRRKGSKSSSSCSSIAAIENAEETAIENASIAAETVVTDQFLAQIATKRGRKITTNELTKMMQSTISSRVDCVLSPDIEKDLTDREYDRDYDHTDAEEEGIEVEEERTGRKEVRERGREQEQDLLPKSYSSDNNAKNESVFCLNLMELLVLNEDAEEQPRALTAADDEEEAEERARGTPRTRARNGASIFSPATTWIDSLAEDVSSALDNNDSVDFYTEGESTNYDQGEATTFDQELDGESTSDDDSARGSYSQADDRDTNHSDASADEHSFDPGWWSRKKSKLKQKRQLRNTDNHGNRR